MFSDSTFAGWVGQGLATKAAAAQAALIGANAQELGAITGSTLGPTQIGINAAHAALLQSQKQDADAQRQFDYGGMPNPTPSYMPASPYGYATGTAMVPGNADPRVDSVRANLAPQEAVLNAGAADMVGRGLIDVLNAMGNLKMGMPAPPAKGAPAATQAPGYARGTSMVAPKAARPKAGAKDNSAGAAALMTFLQGMGGGGMPPMSPPPGPINR